MEKLELKDRIVSRIPYIGGEPIPNIQVEMLYRPEKKETLFAIYRSGEIHYEKELPIGNNKALIPYSPENNLLRNQIILFPYAAEDYERQEYLLDELRAFIHRYVTVTTLFENITAHYVLLTWIYESFSTLPYLRVRGDYGSGKSRFLTVIANLCFRPIFTGTSTVSALFRVLHMFRGTLVIDEGDFRTSDFRSDITKVLNNGNSKGFPVLRSEQAGRGKEFNPVAFNVFGPKIIATRGYYQDAALESRFISEDMGRNKPRSDIPLHLPKSFTTEATQLRNKLLMFRFRNLHRYSIDKSVEGTLEPRIAQIFAPLLTIVQDERQRGEILELLQEYSQELSLDRTFEVESRVVEVIKDLWTGAPLSIKAITARFNERHSEEAQEVLSAKRVGFVVRKILKIRTRKRHGVFEVLPTETEKLQMLFRRYEMPTEEPVR